MQTVSSMYLEGMGNVIRKPSRMRLTFHYPTGDIVYNNADIVKVTEKKTAHLIAGELPSIELEMELVNLDGSFNPNDISGLHDLIVKGVPVTYEFGYDIPNLQYYGYTDDGEEHDYGMEENVPYGFREGYATEWIPGGEVFTSGEISYSKTTATISAKDHLSFLDEHVLLAYGNRTLAQVAKDVLSLTDYPKEEDGDPKIITGPELDAFNTAITLSETEDESISAKEHLQTIAHACGVQMYIDRAGYIHLDNAKRGLGSVYELPLSHQGEAPEHRKEQMPKKMVIVLNSEYGDPVETDLNGGGETMTVENPFIVTTAEGETLSEIIYDHFIKYRNTADIPYRGEPALDILDTITLGTDFGGDVEAIVVGTELAFDGTLSGSLSVRYQLGGNTPEKVQIKGSGNFIYPLGVNDEPSITSFDLVCETTFPTPTYQWSYFTVSNGSWLNIAGATSNTLSVAYNSSYYNNDSSVKFRCVVNGIKGAITQISKIQLQKSETAGYRGVQKKATKEEIDVPSPQIGDVVLLDNTDNANASVYGEAHVYDGEKWVATEESDALAMTYKDALQLAEDSGETIHASKVVTDLLVANEAFIGKLFTNQIELSEQGAIYSGYSADGITPPLSGAGFWLGASGKLKAYFAELLGTLRTGLNAPTDARIAIQDESGIISGPTFTGSGLNDLAIMKDGGVAGSFRVKISGINNATNSGKPGYWATPFKVGTAWWDGIAVNSSGKFVAVGRYGYVSHSNDGITWATPFRIGTRWWYGIAVNSSGRFVAVGEGGYVSHSNDGITWATPFNVGTNIWNDVAVNSAGRFVAVGGSGYVSHSNDGITWATPFRVGDYSWRAIAVNSSGRFVAVSHQGYVSYSNDGITWATPFQISTYDWYAIAVNSSGRFIAGGDGGYVSYSNDGISWVTPFKVGTNPWHAIAVNSSGRFVAVGEGGYVSHSNDGITWATPFRVGDYSWWAIAVNSSGRFVAVGGSGYISMSLLQDTIQISSNGGTTWGSDIPIPSGEAISIAGFDIDILFGHTEGHTVGDYWSFEQGAMRGLVITDSAGDEYFSASDGVVNVKETLLLSGIPTSATGLPSGSVWRDGTTLKIV